MQSAENKDNGYLVDIFKTLGRLEEFQRNCNTKLDDMKKEREADKQKLHDRLNNVASLEHVVQIEKNVEKNREDINNLISAKKTVLDIFNYNKTLIRYFKIFIIPVILLIFSGSAYIIYNSPQYEKEQAIIKEQSKIISEQKTAINSFLKKKY